MELWHQSRYNSLNIQNSLMTVGFKNTIALRQIFCHVRQSTIFSPSLCGCCKRLSVHSPFLLSIDFFGPWLLRIEIVAFGKLCCFFVCFVWFVCGFVSSFVLLFCFIFFDCGFIHVFIVFSFSGRNLSPGVTSFSPSLHA